MIKKILLSLFFLTFLFSAFPKPSFAQSAGLPQKDYWGELQDIYCKRRSGTQINLETWYGGKCYKATTKLEDTIGFGDIIWIDLYTKVAGDEPMDLGKIFGALLSARTPTEVQKAIAEVKAQTNGNLLFALTGIMGDILQTPPVSFTDYVASVKQNLNHNGIVQPAYAQATAGFGFNALTPILPIWRTFRNISYMLFAIVFVIYGFFIMFQVRISAQATATIQSSIPKIIVALVLITFSYAIVGLLIDLFYVAVGLGWSILKTGKIVGEYGALGDSFAKYISGQTIGLYGPLIAMLGYLISGNLTARVLSAFMDGTIAGILTILLNPIIGLIIFIASIITVIRIIWMLIKSYINIVIQTIFSPLLLLPEVLPGGSAFGNWIRGIIAELMVFAATIFGLTLAFYFMGAITLPFIQAVDLYKVGDLDTSKDFWFPVPLFGSGGNAAGKFSLLGIGIFFMIPKLADIIQKAMKVSPFAYGSAITEALNNKYTQPVKDFGAKTGKGLATAAGKAAWNKIAGPRVPPSP